MKLKRLWVVMVEKKSEMKPESSIRNHLLRIIFIFMISLIGLMGMTFWIWTKNKESKLGFHASRQEGALEGLGLYGQIPDFSLIERSGRSLGLAELQGKVWIANFIYTHCPDTCPLQSAQMATLQKNLSEEKDVRFVSISVDPERDTPEVLSQYAERYGADPDRWFFLTGEKEAIYRLAQEGFHLSIMEIFPEGDVTHASHEHGSDPEKDAKDIPHIGSSHNEGSAAETPYIHSARFALVDRQGQIRGYYLSADSEAIQRLLHDVRTLLQEKI